MKKADLYTTLKKELAKEDYGDTPLYMRLSNALEQVLKLGLITEGEAIPSERKLADSLGIARGTVRQAVKQLVETGRLRRRHGARSIVRKRLEKSLSNLVGFSEDMLSRGITPGTIMLSQEYAMPNIAEAKALKIPPGDKIMRMKRIRTADEKAIAFECAAVPADILTENSYFNGSLYEALKHANAEPVLGFQRIRAAIADDQDSLHLGCEKGNAILIIERLCEDKNGFPVEFTQTRYKGDNYEFLTELVK